MVATVILTFRYVDAARLAIDGIATAWELFDVIVELIVHRSEIVSGKGSTLEELFLLSPAQHPQLSRWRSRSESAAILPCTAKGKLR